MHQNKVVFESPLLGYAYHRLILDEDGNPYDSEFLEVNKSFEEATGLTKEKVVGRTVRETIPGINDSDFDWIGIYGEIALNGGEKVFEQFNEVMQKWFKVHACSSERMYFSTTFIDITDMKRSEELISRERELLRAIINHSPDSIYVKDSEARKIIANPKDCFYSGVDNEEDLIGKTDFDLYSQEEAGKFFEDDQHVLKFGKSIQNREEKIKGPKGDAVWLLTNKIPLYDHQGNINGLLGVGRDITERKLAEEALRKEEESKSILLDNIQIQVWYLTDPSTYGAVNKVHANFKGYEPHELANKSFYDIYPKELADEWKKANEKAFHAKETIQSDKWREDGSGELRYISLKRTPKFNADGVVEYLFCTAEDLTDQKMAEDELLRRENLLRDIQTISKTGGWEYTVETDEMYWTDELYRIHEMEKDPEIDHIAESLKCYLPQQRGRIEAAFQKCLEEGIGYDLDFQFRTLKGNDRWIRTKTEPFLENGKVVKVIGTVIDITEQKESESARRELLNRLEQLGRQLPGFIYQFKLRPDGTSCFQYASDGIQTIYGVSPEEVAKDAGPVFDVLHPDDLDRVSQSIRDSALQMNTWKENYRVHLPDGRMIWVEGNATTQKMEDGSVLWHGYIYDITDRKKAEEALEHERNLFTKGPVFTIEWAPDLARPVKHVSENVKEILGYTVEEMTNASFFFISLIHPDDVDRISSESYKNILEKVDTYEQSYRLKNKAGEYRWFYDFTKVERDESMKITSIRGYMFDQTRQKLMESDLNRERIRLANIIKGTNVGTWEWNIQTGETIFNERWADIIGYTLEEISPVSIRIWESFTHPDDLKKSATLLEDHFNGRIDYYEMEARMRHKQGHWVWVLDRGRVAEWTEDGKPLRMMGTHQDISARKRSEQDLRESEEKFRQITESMGEVFWLRSADNSEMIYINPAYEKVWGRSCQSLYENPDSYVDSILDEDKATAYAEYEKYMKTGFLDFEYRISRPDGSIRWVRAQSFPVKDNQGKTIRHSGIALDITEKKEAEIELKKLSVAIQQSPASVIITNPDGIIEYVNPKFIELTGYRSEEVIGRKPGILKSGRQSAELYREMWDTITAGKTWRGDLLNRKKNGDLFWESANISPIFDNQGKITHYLGIKEDISERKRYEQDLIQAKAAAEAANQAKSQFLANMSHELRTPLNGVIGFTEMLNHTPLSDVQQQYVDSANISGHNLLRIINDILDLSKIEAGMLELDPVRTDLIELVQNSVNIVKSAADQKNLKLLLEIDSNVPRHIKTDPVRLTQILTNLLGNAIKFTEKGEVGLQVNYKPLRDGMASILLSIRDTGIGISEEQKQKLFKAFSQADSSTTRRFGGTGLGLIISQMIARKLGSEIELESEPGRGSRFFFEISVQTEPQLDENAVSNDDQGVATKIPGQHHPLSGNVRSILIAEDVSLNMTLICALLQSVLPDAELIRAVNGEEAVELWKKRNPDLVLMDIQMPKMDGLEATLAIRQLEQQAGVHTPIIALTAAAMKEDQDKCFAAGMDNVLTKPIETAKLKSMIGQLLNS